MYQILQKFDMHWHDGGPSIAMMFHLRRVSDLLCNWKSCLLCYMKDVVLHCSIFFKWNKLVRVRVRVRKKFLAPIVAEVRQSGPWEPAVDGRPWRAAGTDFWNKRHRFLAPIVAEVRQSEPWEPAVTGRRGWTFETNGTDSWRRLFQKSVRSGRGRLAVTGIHLPDLAYQRDAIPTQLAHKAVFTSICTGSNIHLNDREADTPVLP